ncbi:MAG: alpha/beta hydrolase [Planctomycetota bacterium]
MRCLALAFAFVWLAGCSGPGLRTWHTTRLDEEFRAARTDEVRTLADYRALEERLYAQLDAKVVAGVETGPAQRLNRYSAGSRSDPNAFDRNWNRTYELGPEDAVGGVVLLHGMSDSPYSLRALGAMLAEEGYRVVGLRLPGHGTAPSGLRSVRAADMTAATRIAMRHLAEELPGKPLHMIGYSTGAALALQYALDAADGEVTPEPANLVLISPAIRIHGGAALASFKDSLAAVPGLGGLGWLQVLPEFDPFRYNSFATNAGDVVHRLTTSVDARLARRARDGGAMPPILVFKSTVDSTVTTKAVVDNLLARLQPRRHALVLFDINRCAASAKLMVEEPAPLTELLMTKEELSFDLTLVTNESESSQSVVALHRKPFDPQPEAPQPLGLAWPPGVISLSHVALPFAPDDPLYGARPPEDDQVLFLGDMALRGERGLLALPTEWLLRMRYNPFYDVVAARTRAWLSARRRLN